MGACNTLDYVQNCREVRTRFIDSRNRREMLARALRGLSAERGVSDELGPQRIYAINLVNEPFAPNYSNAHNNILHGYFICIENCSVNEFVSVHCNEI